MKARIALTIVQLLIPVSASLLLQPLGVSAQVYWQARYDGPAHGIDRGVGMAVDAAGNVVVTGTSSRSGPGTDIATVKYNAQGTQQWVARFAAATSFGAEDIAKAVSTDAAGNVYVAGESHGAQVNAQFAVVKYDSDGNEVWRARQPAGATELDVIASALAVTPAGESVVTGIALDRGRSSQAPTLYTVKLGADGQRLWEHRYAIAPASSERPPRLTLDASGNVLVAAVTEGAIGRWGVVTVKYSPGGTFLWSSRYDPGTFSFSTEPHVSRVATDAAGNVIVAGDSSVDVFRPYLFTLKYDPDGRELWVNRFSAGRATATDLAVDTSGNAFVAGYESASPFFTVHYPIVIKYDAQGRTVWAHYYRSLYVADTQTVEAIGLNDAGEVYFVGVKYDNPCVVGKLDALGTRVWSAIRGPAGWVPSTLRVQGAATVYLSGTQSNDFVTTQDPGGGAAGLPVIVTAPQNQLVLAGTSATFSVSATGPGPLRYRWVRPGTVGPTMTMPNVIPQNAGEYVVEVSNAAGTVVSAAATLGVFDLSYFPRQDAALLGGNFGLNFYNAQPQTAAYDLRYQWQLNGTAIPGATNYSFVRYGLTAADAGDYTVVATMGSTSVTGLLTTLTLEALRLYRPPQSEIADAGDTIHLSVGVTSAAAVRYQWQFNGVDIPRATNEVLVLSNIGPAQVGAYRAIAVNEFGSVTSDPATVTLNPLTPWTWRRPLPQGNDLVAVAFGDGTFAAVGAKGTLLLSTNAEQWIDRSLREPLPLSTVAVGGGRIVAAGLGLDPATLTNRTIVVSSRDGTNWTRASVPSEFANALAYGNGVYFLASVDGVLYRSNDAVQWETAGSAGVEISGVAFGLGRFIAVSPGGSILSSTTGREWTVLRTDPTRHYRAITFGSGKFVAVGDRAAAVSEDGVSWNTRSLETLINLQSVIAGSGDFAARDSSDSLWASKDGLNWSLWRLQVDDLDGADIDFEPHAIGFGKGRYVVVGQFGNIATATSQGGYWRSRTTASTRNLRGIANGSGRFITVGNDGENLTSADGVAWTPGPVLTRKNLHKVAWGPPAPGSGASQGLFVATGNGGTVLTTRDGANWTQVESGTPSDLYGITFGDGRFVTVGDHGAVGVSTDGVIWENHNAGTNRLHGVAYGAGLFVTVGRNGSIQVSTNGADWESSGDGLSRAYLKSVTYGYGRFVIVGDSDRRDPGTAQYYGQVLVSTNGRVWERILTREFHNLDDVATAAGMFVAVGDLGQVVSSVDGLNWHQQRTPASTALRGIAAGAGTLVIVGNNDLILQSARFLPAPRIVQQPVSLVATNIGADIVLSVTADGAGPLTYQWTRNGLSLSGETNAVLSRTAAQMDDSGYYAVLVSNAHGLIASDVAAVFVPVPDWVAPTLTLHNSRPFLSTDDEFLATSGTAEDNRTISTILVRRNGGEPWAAHGTNFWVFATPLLPGTNYLTFQAVDGVGNLSAPITRIVYRRQRVPLELEVEGAGIVQGARDGEALEISRSYALTARPAAKWFFTGWTGSIETSDPTVRFVMRSNVTLTAHFVTNRFGEARGRYEGLFMPADAASVNQGTAGRVVLQVSAAGLASGQFQLAGRTTRFSGRMAPDGSATFNISRPLPLGSFRLSIQLDFATHTMTGVASTVAANSPFSAVRLDDSGRFAGRHTVVVASQGPDSAGTFTTGAGFASVLVNPNGTLHAAGRLPNGTPWTQSSSVGLDGRWPVLHAYQSDVFTGWAQFSTEAPHIRSTDVLWHSRKGTAAPLPWEAPPGRTYATEMLGARYARPALAWTQGLALGEGGDLSPFDVPVPVVREGALLRAPDHSSRLQLQLNPVTGIFQGGFQHHTSGQRTPVYGAVLQLGNTNAYGLYLGTNQVGPIVIEPQ